MTDEDLLRELRRLVDPAGGGIGVKPDAVYRYVLENIEAARHETAMHDAYQKHARSTGWTVCSMCYRPFGWPHEMGFVTDGGKVRATCRQCAPRPGTP